jgi:hypothetical protein
MNNFNELKTIFSNLKVDIPIFYRDNTKDSVIAKFMYNGILIVQTTYNRSNAAIAQNFKQVLRGRSIQLKDTERVNLSWSSRT